jgi:hypothetical protein
MPRYQNAGHAGARQNCRVHQRPEVRELLCVERKTSGPNDNENAAARYDTHEGEVDEHCVPLDSSLDGGHDLARLAA